MSPYRFPNSLQHLKRIIIGLKAKWLDLLNGYMISGFMPVIIEHTFAITSHENDGDCIKDVVNSINNDKYKLISNREINCYE